MTGMRDGAARRPASALAGRTALVAAVATAAVAGLPYLDFAYQAPAVHVMLETANAVVAVLVGFLVYGRFKESRRLQDLRLGLALATVALANLVLTAVPDALTLGRSETLSQWAPLGVRLLGTAMLAGAALTPVTARVGRRAAGLTAGSLIVVLAGLGAAGLAWGHLLPATVDLVAVGDTSRPDFSAHPAVLVAQALGIALYGLAAVAFARQADRTGDELIRWVAAGCVLASFARVHYLLFPSLYTEYVYSGDVLRLGFYAFMLVGAVREITSLWQAKAQSAVLEDRRRIARDLHDGLIQELAYIHAQAQRLAAHPADTLAVERIGGAARRAIDESRRALAALARSEEGAFPEVLQGALEEMASRYDVKIVTAIDRDAEADAPMAEALLRIAGEAVRNAVRHGAAHRIDVRLTASPMSLTVTDDGRGFATHLPDGGRTGGFGLTSMRERAEGIGATLSIDSTPGEGTTVQVSWI